MTVTETLGGLGSWELRLADTTPDFIVAQLGFFGHVVIVDGHLPVGYVESAGNGLLAGARYVGVCRAQDHPAEYVRSGSSPLFWLGDEDGKGAVIESQVTLTNATLAQVVAALKPATVTTGTVFAQADPAARYTGSHIFQTPREALAVALAPFGAELRVRPDFSIDVGTPSQLYNTATPDKIIKRRAVGADMGLAALGGTVDVQGNAIDYSSRIVLLGQTIGTGGAPDTVFATGAISAPSNPWKDPQGNPAAFTRLISESGQTTGSVAARAQLQLNRFNRSQSAVKVTADEFEMQGTFATGDAVYVYDPDSGIVNAGIEVLFRGEKLNPDIVRVTGRTWPIVEGMTVAWRTDTGAWLDLTPWVVWETAGTHELTVGDLPKTLFKQGTPNGAVQDRLDATRGTPDSVRVPKAPTGLALSTSSAVNPKGTDSAVITASWAAVTQYTDNTTVALSYYEVQYRWSARAPQWQPGAITSSTTVDLPAVAALPYDVQVRAWSTGGVPSAWSAAVSITSAADTTGPATPSDPVVTSYLGLLRIFWDGLTSTAGAMPSDFTRVDVHVGTISTFTASAATLVSSLSAAGYAHAQAPYGATRFVRFIAYDRNGNASAASATVSGATVQAADGDIAALSVGKLTAGIMTADVTISGRFTTALTGARVEHNSLGFQGFQADGTKWLSLTSTESLLTGVFQTALAGSRRIVIGAAGSVGEIDFYAPDGTLSFVKAYTESTGIESIQFGVQIPGSNSLWNRINYNNNAGGYANYRADKHEFFMGQSSGYFNVWATPDQGASKAGYAVLAVSSDQMKFTRLNGGYLHLTGAFTNDTARSPLLKFLTPQNYGSGIQCYYDPTVPSTPLAIEITDVFGTAFSRIRASSFDVSSDAATKNDIEDAAVDFLSELRTSVRPRRYRRKKSHDEDPEQPVEIGLLTQEAPDTIRVGDGERSTIGLYQLGVFALGGLKQLDADVRALAADVEKLKKGGKP